MAVIRIDETDHGSVRVWDDSDPDNPILIPRRKAKDHWNRSSRSLTGQGTAYVNQVLTQRGNAPDTSLDSFSSDLDSLLKAWDSEVQAKVPNDQTQALNGRAGSDVHAAIALLRRS